MESIQNKAPVKKKKSARKRLYELHTWVGFHLAVIMAVVLFTGTMATISNELDWLTQHDMRVSPGEEKVSYDEMLESVREYEPSATILSVQHMMGDHFAYRVSVFDENATQKFIHVNQWTGEVTGETPYFTLQRFFRDMHRYLYLPKVVGLTLVCSMAIILIISLYTGLKTSRNWGTLMTRIRFSKGTRTAIGDAHKAAGLWRIWFFVLMVTTGLWYYAEFLGSDFEPAPPPELTEISSNLSDVVSDPSGDEIVRVAQEAYPELNITGFNYSLISGSAIRVIGKAGNPIVRDRANAVYLHPETLEVLHVRRSGELPAVQWTNQIADPLHFGDFGGLPLKLVYFVFGVFMTGLSVSGVWLTWKRLKSRGASRMQIAAMPILVVSALFASITYTASKQPILAGVSPIPYAIFVLGLFLAAGALICFWWLSKRVRSGKALSWKTALVAILTIALTTGAAQATLTNNPYKSGAGVELGMLSQGPLQASLSLFEQQNGRLSGEAKFVVSNNMNGGAELGTARLNISKMTVHLLKDGSILDDGEKKVARRFRVAAASQPAYFKLSADQLSSATEIRATFEMKSGALHDISWSIPKS